jgi:hypothetical protein
MTIKEIKKLEKKLKKLYEEEFLKREEKIRRARPVDVEKKAKITKLHSVNFWHPTDIAYDAEIILHGKKYEYRTEWDRNIIPSQAIKGLQKVLTKVGYKLKT